MNYPTLTSGGNPVTLTPLGFYTTNIRFYSLPTAGHYCSFYTDNSVNIKSVNFESNEANGVGIASRVGFEISVKKNGIQNVVYQWFSYDSAVSWPTMQKSLNLKVSEGYEVFFHIYGDGFHEQFASVLVEELIINNDTEVYSGVVKDCGFWDWLRGKCVYG